MLKRAYSQLTIKSIDEDARIIEGIATTPSTDRMGDIVEPKGAEYKLPLPLLMGHSSAAPIGHVIAAKVSDEGISIRAQLVKISEPGTLKDRLDEAWQSIKSGLVRGLSIGFTPIESARIKDSFSEHFLKWSWLELSAVVIPANADASITSIKSADKALLAASGDRQREVVRLGSSPGASGSQSNPKGKTVQTVAQQIASFEAKRAASAERMSAIMATAAEAGSTLDEAQTQEYDGLAAEVKAVDEHLVRLKAHEAQMVKTATPITKVENSEDASKARGGVITVRPNVEPGIRFARAAIAMHKARGNMGEAARIFKSNQRWMDQTPEIEIVLKTAIPAADTTTAGWASELVYAQNMQSEFVEFLRPMTILGRLTGVRRVPFNVRMGSMTAGTTGYWVGQGKAIPMSKGTTSSLSLGITKAAGLSAYDDELLKSSSPSIELLVRNDLAKAVAQTIDVSFIDPNNGGVANITPASILYGVTPIIPSGTNAAAIATDVAAVFAAAIAANLDPTSGVWVMSPTTALKLSLMLTSLGNPQYPGIGISGGTWQGLPVIVSPNATITGSPQFGSMIVLILQNELFVADDGDVDIQISNEASFEMLDNPTNLSTGGTAATAMVSMFQTQSWAIKAVRYCNWTKRRAAAAAFIQAAAYA